MRVSQWGLINIPGHPMTMDNFSHGTYPCLVSSFPTNGHPTLGPAVVPFLSPFLSGRAPLLE